MSYLSKRLDERVIQILRYGGVGFMPSDTIYGLSCMATNEAAVERIYRLKRRDSGKPLIVLIATKSQLTSLGIKDEEAEPAEAYWPGPLTLICQMHGAEWLHRGTKTLAVRMPNDKQLLKVISEVGPVVSTSTNLQGGKPADSVAEAKAYFGEELDFYVDVGDFSGREASTLVRNNNGKLEVVRTGAVKL